MEEGVWVHGEAGIGEGLVDSVMLTIRWAGEGIYRGNVFFSPLLGFLEGPDMEHVDFRLDGRVGVETGVAQGLGLAVAQGLASVGSNIVIADVQDVKAEEGVDSIARHYRNTTYAVHMDVSDKLSINNAAQEVLTKFGKVDILINNAGIVLRKKIEDTEERDWDRVMDVNLKGVFLCSQAFGKPMIERKGGKIINISSFAGLMGMEDRICYGVSKSGVVHLTRLFAYEWARYNIIVNAIIPGFFLTEISKSLFNQPKVKSVMVMD